MSHCVTDSSRPMILMQKWRNWDVHHLIVLFKRRNLNFETLRNFFSPFTVVTLLPVSVRRPRAPKDPLPPSLLLFAGRLVASLVAEFLQFFNLDFTLAVFQPETSTVRMMLFTSVSETAFDTDGFITSWKLTKFDNLLSLILHKDYIL